MPECSTRPQRRAKCHSTSTSRTSSRGCEAMARSTSRSAARLPTRRSSSCVICGHGRARSANAVVQHGQARRLQRAPAGDVLEDLLRRAHARLQQVTGADQLGRRPVADARVHGDHAVQHQQAGSATDDGEPRVEVALADLRLDHRRGDHLARREPHPQVEGVGEVVVGVEQEAVRRRELACPGGRSARSGHCERRRAADPLASSDIAKLPAFVVPGHLTSRFPADVGKSPAGPRAWW